MPVAAPDLTALFIEFLEAAVHTTLYSRNLYSKDLFEKTRIYSVFVRHSRHPQLNTYISEAITRLRVRGRDTSWADI